jgi:glycolate oxidase FAD binding subunit
LTERLSNPQTIAADLTAILGPEHVRIADDAVAVAPANTEQVALVLRFSDERRLSVSTVGSGTKQRWGGPVQPKIILRTHRLNALLEHTWQDMTCSVQAGCPWSAMQTALAQHGQFVALDPLWPDRASVGGITATNDSGALRLKYGSLRDLVIGMTIVLADGTIARSGGKVVKNVAGYDLHKLMIGAFGTLGLMTEVTFRLHSLPTGLKSFTIGSPTPEPLGNLLLQLLDSHLNIQSMQLRAAGDVFGLDIQLSALPEVLNNQGVVLSDMARKAQLSIQNAAAETWDDRLLLFTGTNTFTIKATMLPSDIARFTSAVHTLGGSAVTQATGTMIASLPVTAVQQLPELRQQFIDAQGSLTVLQQPASTDLDLWGAMPSSFPLMQKIKQQFDPNRTLNPGRFFGGI